VIPIRDSEPSGITPYVTIGLIALNILCYLLQLGSDDYLVEGFAFRPAILAGWIEGEETVTEPEAAQNPFGLAQRPPRQYDISLSLALLPLFTSMFLHGGFLHLFGNMLFLWIFGDNVEGRLGHLRFLLFYIICGVAASVFHTLFNPDSLIQTVGASGAIYGVLGAYWLCFPHSLVTILYWFYIVFGTFQMRASWVLGIKVALDLFSGLNNTGGNVAVWAHIGGFIAGLGLIILMTPPSARGKRPTRWSIIR